MAHLSFTTLLFTKITTAAVLINSVRELMTKQLVYTQFGDPLSVIKYRENIVRDVGETEVLVRMLAAPINPSDLNTIKGVSTCLPELPTIPGDEGVGNVVEIGKKVTKVNIGDRVIITKPRLGTWRYYGIFDELDLFKISPNIPLPEASMITAAPSTAYRLIKDFYPVRHGETIIQNAANSAVGQSVIQIARALGINTFNIVATHCQFEAVKDNLNKLGATGSVFTLEEAEQMTNFSTSLRRPILGLNCLGGRYEDVLLRLLAQNGAMVYYGCAYNSMQCKRSWRPDLSFDRFDIADWYRNATCIEKSSMISNIAQLIATGKFKAPMYTPVELKNYITALRNTVQCEAYSTVNYVFDFTVP
ncbi:alcohol dehydrogenase groES-like domain-containing protein [Phthorimaea operculella]|nr:alcohol dehydrogenase groES-like domain-containing protein [Phthorimaea operculella]